MTMSNILIKNYPLEQDVKYSEEQIRAIDIENSNILVSAAAGSGKTKVLVERIVKELETGICDINDILVMTFTRAATAEMKNRIKLRIEERIKYLRQAKDIKDNIERIKRLRNQSLFIQNANISTIDSFCKRMVDENFSLLDELDAKYRVADENELNILKSDLLDRFLESKYDEIDKGYKVNFNEFFKCYYEKNDSVIRSIILDGIKFLESLAYVDVFFDKQLIQYDKTNKEINKESDKNTSVDIEFIKSITELEDDDKTKKNDYILLVLLKEFYEILNKEKAKRKIVSISDFQKFALQLLKMKDKDSNLILASKYQNKFKRIMVDEYQDTSDIQEEILKAISNDFNNYNVFMVGDVKQCIYAFRNAKPNIFNEKYNSYIDINELKANTENKNILIKLNKNYRSSNEVIDSTNIIFNNLMIKEYGNIDYKETGVKLLHGRDENKSAYQSLDKKTEIIAFQNIIRDVTDDVRTDVLHNQLKQGNIKNNNDYKLNLKWNKQDRVSCVFDIITKLHDVDGIDYKDIVILHPTPASLVDDYAREAARRDIPFVGNLKAGFYNSYEIMLMCAILSVIDNPVNDVDLSTVLLSKLIDMTDNDFVMIKCVNNYLKKKSNLSRRFFSLYETIFDINNDEDLKKEIIDNDIVDKKSYELLQEKVKLFSDLFIKLREYQRIKSISELVNIIYDEANIYNYMRTMKNGNIRISNLDLFLLKAKAYEETSYSGLFNFLRYIEQIKINDIDESPASSYDEHDDVIRLLSIHSSKGLEYPVVILPNLDSKLKPFNKTATVLYDKEYGIGLMDINYKERYAHESIKYNLIKTKKEDEEKQEKIRLLYVGLTRAKEKLILAFKTKSENYKELFKEEKQKKTKTTKISNAAKTTKTTKTTKKETK